MMPWQPDETAAEPNVARMYDYWLGGYHNFAVDRAAAEAVSLAHPDVQLMARVNRAFVRRVVAVLLARGIDQFLDIGSGLPTQGNVHELVAQATPAARVVYVDHDPVVVAHSQTLLAGASTAVAIQADARDPAAILEHPATRRLLDFTRPVAVLLFAVLHFLPDAEADGLVRALRVTVAPGSYLALSHGVNDPLPQDVVEDLSALYARSSAPVSGRTCAQIERFFAGLDLVPPGIVYLPQWRPSGPDDMFLDEPARSAYLGGVGRQP